MIDSNLPDLDSYNFGVNKKANKKAHQRGIQQIHQIFPNMDKGLIKDVLIQKGSVEKAIEAIVEMKSAKQGSP